MMKIGDIIGDIVYLKFANPEFLSNIGIKETDGHFYVRGKDELGLWVAHPGLEVQKILDKKGKLKVASTINPKWKADEAIIFLYTHYLSLYGSEIKATFVKPEPESMPIISRTLP